MSEGADASVTEIVFEALELDNEARRAYLDRACGPDRDLREEVESLLGTDDSKGISRFLARPVLDPDTGLPQAPSHAGVPGDPSTSEHEIPERIGPFRIDSRLGFGGMGTVYLAEQDEPIERRVAVKVVHALHHAEWRSRFASECQALARLNHPHIAALYEVGTTRGATGDGLPYVAMELIDGEPITEWCDRENATLERRLDIFLDVCSGIAHAHQNGILHCDLKPANILVTRDEARAKVIDFGIARAVDDLSEEAALSRELLFGSPPYISPEILGHGTQTLDTRTDVYALGLILYELLVGVLPFRASSTWLLMLQVSEKEPEPPSQRFSGLSEEEQVEITASRSTQAKTLVRRCRGDLDAIVTKAIDRDPDRRYGSPVELAEEIRRFLDGRTVQARLPSPSEQLGRFLRRHRQLAIAAFLLFTVLSAGLVARTMEARRANAEAARANTEAERANAETERARAALAESEQIREFLIELFEAADPTRSAGGEEVTVAHLLDTATEKLRSDLEEQPLVRASLLQTVGTIHRILGSFGQAADLLAEAVEIRGASLPADDPLVLRSKTALAHTLIQLGRYTEAQALLVEVLELRQADAEADRALLAETHESLGKTLRPQGKLAEAEKELRAALELRRELGNAEKLAEAANSLAILLHRRNALSEARALFDEALEIFRRELGPEHPRVAGLLNNLGLAARYQPSWEEAEGLFREAASIYQEVFGPGHFRALRARRNLVTELGRKHRWNEAIREAEEILRLSEIAGDPVTVASARQTLGQLETQAGLHHRALRTLGRCVDDARPSLGPMHTNTLACRNLLAKARVERGEVEPGLAEMDALVAGLEQRRIYRRVQTLWIAHAESLLDAQRYAEAEERIRLFFESFADGSEPSPADHSSALQIRGRAHAGRGQLDAAAESLNRALDLLEQTYGPNHPRVAQSAHALGLIEKRRGRIDEARELLRRAVSIRAAIYPEGDRDTEASKQALASLDPG